MQLRKNVADIVLLSGAMSGGLQWKNLRDFWSLGRKRLIMNHDYAHCADYTDRCPRKCFRGELVRDLENYKYPVSWMNLKGSEECLIRSKKDESEE